MRNSLLKVAAVVFLCALFVRPADAAISKIAADCTGTTSCTTTGNATGDLEIAYAGRDGSTTAPTLPAGWTNLGTASINGTSTADSVVRMACKVATGANEASGTFTNAGALIIQVYRGQLASATSGCANVIMGAPSFFTSTVNTTTTTETFNSLTTLGNTSWVVGFGYAPAATAGIGTAPSGMTNRNSQGTIMGGHDTNAGTASYSTANVTLTTAGRIITGVVEIKGDCPDYLCADVYQHMNTGTNGDALTSTNADAGSAGSTGWAMSASPMTGVTLAAQQQSRKCTVTVSGTQYATSQASKAIAFVHNTASSKTWNFSPPAGTRRITIAGIITVGAPSNSSNLLYDYYIAKGGTTGQYATLQLRAGNGTGGINYAFNVETNPGGVTTHSSYTTVTVNTAYWGTLTADFNAGTFDASLYKVSDWSLVVNITGSMTSGEDVGEIRVGNNEFGNGTGTSYFDQTLIDWSRAIAPLGPGSCSTGGLVMRQGIFIGD